jgi:hypothetical protein
MSPYLLAYPVRGLVLAAPIVIAVTGLAQAACYSSRQQLPVSTLAQFMADPGQLQSKYPNGGARMISTIRDLVASDPSMLPRVLDLSANSNAEQIAAIGAGLGQAALVCSRGDPTFANEIHQMVAAVNNQPLTVTFAGVVGNSPVAAADGRDVKNTRDTGAVPSAGRNGGIASPATALTGQPGSPFFTAPPGSPAIEATASTNPGTTAPQGVTSALGVPTGTTATGTGSAGATGSAGPTPQGTTSVPGALTGTTTGATSTTAPTTTGTTSSPALSTGAGVVTGLTSAQTTGTSNTIGATTQLVTTPIGTTTPGALTSTSQTIPTTAITPTIATSTPGAIASGATSSPSTAVTSATTTAGISTGFPGSAALGQTTVAPTGFFTLDSNAKGQPVVGGTKNASSWRSVSPSQ